MATMMNAPGSENGGRQGFEERGQRRDSLLQLIGTLRCLS